MLSKAEDRLLKFLLKRQNLRRYDIPAVTYQDCMDLLFVLAKRLDKIEKVLKAKTEFIVQERRLPSSPS